jgi:hypothetical protein
MHPKEDHIERSRQLRVKAELAQSQLQAVVVRLKELRDRMHGAQQPEPLQPLEKGAEPGPADR